MLEIALLLLIITSIAAIQTRYMRQAVIYLGLFSLAISFVYLLYSAPDVALAEAIIGSTISTILYIVALQKYKIYTIYYKLQSTELDEHATMSLHKQQLIKSLEKFCSKQELETQIIYSTEDIKFIMEQHQYALILEEKENTLVIYAHPENYKFDALKSFLEIEVHPRYHYEFVKVEEDIL
ncbi:DUF4040 domain-containing protein [Fusibacter bizertensis]|jgi:uncharacterized MnhB-related membrane protein|uniref:DUF4040 domain-containing protein n=1 Tax=Fusibacter bizertensis TaxID=1488331 RepID=A0ABT6NBI6_9FIRM|nr:DUF4040 domain-containing protein [Fusibacter bizertensis]MDH8677756.1 DUF4040 domain-containing protein [Fusibacter bizertensis]